jgi:hypothetical protein
MRRGTPALRTVVPPAQFVELFIATADFSCPPTRWAALCFSNQRGSAFFLDPWWADVAVR